MYAGVTYQDEVNLQDLVRRLESGQTLEQAAVDWAEERLPFLWQHFYPRFYESTSRYYSPKIVAAMMCIAVNDTQMSGIDQAASAHKLIAPAIKPLIDHKMPMFFLAPDFLDAIEQTTFDEPINWTELKLPFEQGIFVFPRDKVIHPIEGPAAFLLWSRVRAGDHPCPTWMTRFPSTLMIDHGSFSFAAPCIRKGMWFDMNLTDAHVPTTRLNRLFDRPDGTTVPHLKLGTLDAPLDEHDDAFIQRLGTIMFGTFLSLNARPTLLTPGRLVSAMKQRQGKTRKEFWSPNLIGANYKAQRSDQVGTHSSPRLHWRRGFFRSQAHGPKNTLRKQLWIEPVLVNAGGDE